MLLGSGTFDTLLDFQVFCKLSDFPSHFSSLISNTSNPCHSRVRPMQPCQLPFCLSPSFSPNFCRRLPGGIYYDSKIFPSTVCLFPRFSTTAWSWPRFVKPRGSINYNLIYLLNLLAYLNFFCHLIWLLLLWWLAYWHTSYRQVLSFILCSTGRK